MTIPNLTVNESINLQIDVEGSAPVEAADFFAQKSLLSKALVKKVMNAGGAWWQRQGRGSLQRVRKATFLLRPGDKIEFYYDPRLSWPDPGESCFVLWDSPQWGVWFKGSGILSEGTRYGDLGSLLRMLEKLKREAFLVHRLDRETSGLMAFAYNKKTCAFLSTQWGTDKVKKFYCARVKGEIKNLQVGLIDRDLDGKRAITEIEKIIEGPKVDEALLFIKLHTGRYHQIRQHLNLFDCPIVGDPRYGRGNKNETGLQLMAYELHLPDPRSQSIRQFKLPNEMWPMWAQH